MFFRIKKDPVMNGVSFQKSEGSEAEVCKSTVRFSHFMDILFLADGVAFVVLGSDEFRSETESHVGFGAIAGGVKEPAQSEGLGTFRSDFHRNLIVRTTDAAGLRLEARLDVFEAGFELFERSFLAFDFLVQFVESGVNDLFGNSLLALFEHDAHEFGYKLGFVARIRENVMMNGLSSSRHILPYFLAGAAAPFFLTPYLERPF